MEQSVLVHVDLQGVSHLAGRLWTRSKNGRESATFEYDSRWLERADRFSLQPVLKAGPGPFHTIPGKALFGSLTDSAPDRWGRVLMRRAERLRADHEGSTPRTLTEIDYLLRVNDESRQGALRFSETEGGEFLAQGERKIPPLIELHHLLSAAERVTEDTESDEDLRLLLAPGSSLGGARPKASVRDVNGHLSIAKFPSKIDDADVVAWEAVALTLAGKAGIETPEWRMENVGGKRVLLLRRFDRSGTPRHPVRIPFLSAMSMLDAHDNERRSYLEIVDALRQHGAAFKDDARSLWRRIVFNILISNTDDHLRNHGFLYAGAEGWRLSPAYDMNPVPVEVKPRILSTNND
jgi:serine/threonine-protein kinase HipA